MKERILDPIFQQKEYYCAICDLAKKRSQTKHEERKQQDMILEEIQRWWDFHLDEKQNYEKFHKSSKLKLTYKMYHQMIEKQSKKSSKIQNRS